MSVDVLPDESDIEFEGNDEDEKAPATQVPRGYTINTKVADPDIESLYRRWKDGKLILQPFFQRQFVWDRTKASRLIESVLLAVPLPSIYLAQEPEGCASVVDGQQRLTSFFAYLDDRFPDDPHSSHFRLTGLKVRDDLNGKNFRDLEDGLQEAIRTYSIRAVTVQRDSDAELKFEIFERLNTGSIPLNDMELRNCVYYGPYMELLKKLADDGDFKRLVGFKGPNTRMRDVELVLRFAAFFHASYLNYQSPMKRFLNEDMRRYRNISDEDAEKLRRGFKNAVQIVKSLFGDRAFHRLYPGSATNPDGSWETKKFNASLYDVLMGIFARVDKHRVFAALDAVREGLLDLMTTNQDFIEAILLSTSSQKMVTRRFGIAHQRVEDILADHPQQPRCFSYQLKQELFDKNPTCAICGQRIQQIDDAAVDHIEQYWRGGQTIPENARLAHRYCNMARSRHD